MLNFIGKMRAEGLIQSDLHGDPEGVRHQQVALIFRTAAFYLH